MFRGDDDKARRNPRLVELRARMLEGIGRVVELWSLDGEVTDVSGPSSSLITSHQLSLTDIRLLLCTGDLPPDESDDHVHDLPDSALARL